MVGNIIVNKPGYSNQIPGDHKIGLARALNFLGITLKNILEHNNISVFNDEERNNLFSKELQIKLNSSVKVYFEGGTIQYIQNKLRLHVDSLNDATSGYNWSGVLANTCLHGRLTYNGYCRKVAHEFMERLEHAKNML